jgi:PhnB protein
MHGGAFGRSFDMANDPQVHRGVIPYLVVSDPAAALDFYRAAFGAQEVLRLTIGDKVGHAEMLIAGARVMMSGEWPDMGMLGPNARGGATSSISVYVDDADAAYARAVAAGAVSERPPSDEFYGDRAAFVRDPFGHRWSLHTHIEDVPAGEMQARMDAVMAAMGAGGGAAQEEAHTS